MLNFWASWCKPCEEEAADLEAAWRKYKDQGIVFVGVDYLDQDPSAKRYLEKFDITFANGPDLASKISKRYTIRGVPETFFIDAEGKLVGCRKIGPLTPDELDRAHRGDHAEVANGKLQIANGCSKTSCRGGFLRVMEKPDLTAQLSSKAECAVKREKPAASMPATRMRRTAALSLNLNLLTSPLRASCGEMQMITDLGYIALVLAFLLAVYGIVVSIVGGLRRLPELVTSGRNAVYVVGALVLLASLLLWRALLTNEFQLDYVAGHTERALPTLYKISAHWGGQAGSLLFWTLIVCGFAVAATWFFRHQEPSLKP